MTTNTTTAPLPRVTKPEPTRHYQTIDGFNIYLTRPSGPVNLVHWLASEASVCGAEDVADLLAELTHYGVSSRLYISRRLSGDSHTFPGLRARARSVSVSPAHVIFVKWADVVWYYRNVGYAATQVPINSVKLIRL